MFYVICCAQILLTIFNSKVAGLAFSMIVAVLYWAFAVRAILLHVKAWQYILTHNDWTNVDFLVTGINELCLCLSVLGGALVSRHSCRHCFTLMTILWRYFSSCVTCCSNKIRFVMVVCINFVCLEFRRFICFACLFMLAAWPKVKLPCLQHTLIYNHTIVLWDILNRRWINIFVNTFYGDGVKFPKYGTASMTRVVSQLYFHEWCPCHKYALMYETNCHLTTRRYVKCYGLIV